MLAKMLFGLLFTALTSCSTIDHYLNEPDGWAEEEMIEVAEELGEDAIQYETGINLHSLTPKK